jgi:hypothetical protein
VNLRQRNPLHSLTLPCAHQDDGCGAAWACFLLDGDVGYVGYVDPHQIKERAHRWFVADHRSQRPVEVKIGRHCVEDDWHMYHSVESTADNGRRAHISICSGENCGGRSYPGGTIAHKLFSISNGCNAMSSVILELLDSRAKCIFLCGGYGLLCIISQCHNMIQNSRMMPLTNFSKSSAVCSFAKGLCLLISSLSSFARFFS